MKFNEKLLSLRKRKGLSQEELGMELQVSRQTVSKWEAGQSYPDFQRLVMLSDYFDLSLDKLVKDIDVQDVREKNMTDQRVTSIYLSEGISLKSRRRETSGISNSGKQRLKRIGFLCFSHLFKELIRR